jgi:hypothetical protein
MRGPDFRRIVLGLDGAFEGAHMGHPDFRAHGRIFATLNAEETFGVVMLTPDQQQTVLAEHPEMFSPGPGAWGRAGSTRVHLDVADEDTVGEAVTLAWQNSVAKAKKRTAVTRAPARSKKKSTPATGGATKRKTRRR